MRLPALLLLLLLLPALTLAQTPPSVCPLGQYLDGFACRPLVCPSNLALLKLLYASPKKCCAPRCCSYNCTDSSPSECSLGCAQECNKDCIVDANCVIIPKPPQLPPSLSPGQTYCNSSHCSHDCVPPPVDCGFETDLTTCAGCPPGSSGFWNLTSQQISCQECPPGKVCPGLLAKPLFDFNTDITPALTTACPMLTGPNASAQPAASAISLSDSSLAAGYAWLTGAPSVDSVVMAGILAGCCVIALYAIGGALGEARGACLLRLFAGLDNFSRVGYVEDGQPIVRRKRARGGAFTLLGVTALLTMVLVLIFTRASNNVASIRAANFMRDDDEKSLKTLPFYSAAPFGAGVQVRVMAAGNPGACSSLLSWESNKPVKASAAPGGAGWVNTFTPNCGGTGVAQFVFTCAACDFESLSNLQLTLDYSCQALLVEAAAIDAEGVMYRVPISGDVTRASKGSLLASVDITTDVCVVHFPGGGRNSPLCALQRRVQALPLTPSRLITFTFT